MSRPPIADGAIRVVGNRILAVGAWSELRAGDSGPIIDLGERVLLPGLINAHCHLDYTLMAGRLSPPKHFTDWIQNIMALKASWGYTEFAESWVQGARMLVQSGATTVVDIEAIPELLPEVWTATPLRVMSTRELINLKNRPNAAELVDRSAREWDILPQHGERIGFSPHSPYATSAGLLTRAAQVAEQRNWLLTTHVAESREEFDMFASRSGRLYEWLSPQRDMADCGLGSPVQHLERCDYLIPRLLAVHVNYLAAGDASILARRGVSVVHCPRSHAYFGHQSFPYRALTAEGVNCCLGTDSLATLRPMPGAKPTLSLFAEMQAFAIHRPNVPPERILEMTTTAPAKSLGRATELGGLFPGALADLIALPYPGAIKNVFEGIANHAGNVDCSMIDGRWILELS